MTDRSNSTYSDPSVNWLDSWVWFLASICLIPTNIYIYIYARTPRSFNRLSRYIYIYARARGGQPLSGRNQREYIYVRVAQRILTTQLYVSLYIQGAIYTCPCHHLLSNKSNQLPTGHWRPQQKSNKNIIYISQQRMKYIYLINYLSKYIKFKQERPLNYISHFNDKNTFFLFNFIYSN